MEKRGLFAAASLGGNKKTPGFCYCILKWKSYIFSYGRLRMYKTLQVFIRVNGELLDWVFYLRLLCQKAWSSCQRWPSSILNSRNQTDIMWRADSISARKRHNMAFFVHVWLFLSKKNKIQCFEMWLFIRFILLFTFYVFFAVFKASQWE